MAFDGGKKTNAYVFVWAIWTYPLLLFIASMLKRRIPKAIFLPFPNVFLLLLSSG
jgi:succinate-acetate transporter protein